MTTIARSVSVEGSGTGDVLPTIGGVRSATLSRSAAPLVPFAKALSRPSGGGSSSASGVVPASGLPKGSLESIATRLRLLDVPPITSAVWTI
jgi:hypothetical protein